MDVTVVQPSLLAVAGRAGPADGSSFEHIELGSGAWVELCSGWLPAPDVLFERLEVAVAWREERRRMYDRVVDVPRLVSFCSADDEWPDPALREMQVALNERYAAGLGEGLVTVGLCLYRDGRDSVAWHGDTIGRGSSEDTVVAIVSLGNRRRFLLRPRGGGTSMRFELGEGDLLVMGGSCQRTFEHSVPKSATAAGARISVQYRVAGVR